MTGGKQRKTVKQGSDPYMLRADVVTQSLSDQKPTVMDVNICSRGHQELYRDPKLIRRWRGWIHRFIYPAGKRRAVSRPNFFLTTMKTVVAVYVCPGGSPSCVKTRIVLKRTSMIVGLTFFGNGGDSGPYF